MPRSYSFDHFTTPKSDPPSRSQRRKAKQQYAESHKQQPGGEGVRYGKSHAQTEELLQAKAMAAQLEELAKPEVGTEEKLSTGEPLDRLHRGAPIGALPEMDELPPRGRLWDLVDEATRQVKALQSGLRDSGQALRRLATLPIEGVRLAAQRLRFVHG